MQNLRRLALCGLSLLSLLSTASAETIVPVNDDPPMAGFPEGAVLDVLGIKLGMTPDEVRAAYGKPMEEKTRRIRQVNPDTGASFDVEYLYMLHTVDINQRRVVAEYIPNQVEVTFGSPIVNNRVVKILNTYRPPFDTPMSTKAFMQGVEKKYGPASATVYGTDELIWVYGPQGRVQVNRVPEDYNLDTNSAGYKEAGTSNYVDGTMPMCWQSSDFGTFGKRALPYKYVPNRYIPNDGCVGGLLLGRTRSDQYYGEPIVAFDQRRIDLDTEALDAAIKEALSKPPSNLIEPKL
jgi:hypothetical protein